MNRSASLPNKKSQASAQHPCPIMDCTSAFSRSDNTIQHFRSHAAKIKKQRTQQAIQSLPDSSPIPDFQYRDILIFKDNVDEAKKEKYLYFANKKPKSQQGKPHVTTYHRRSLPYPITSKSAEEEYESAESPWSNFEFPSPTRISLGSQSSCKSEGSPSGNISPMSIEYLASSGTDMKKK